MAVNLENYVRNAVVMSIHDGDTITVTVDLGYRTWTRVPLRFNRINAPELNTAEGKIARDYLATQIPVGSSVVVKTYANPEDKYGRWLADVYLINGQCVNDIMVATNHAAYYSGHGPKNSLQPEEADIQ